MQDDNSTPTVEDTVLEPQVADTSAEDTEAAAEAAEGSDEPSELGAAIAAMGLTRMSLQELKDKSPADLLSFAETMEVENANSMRKQDMMFAILKTLAEEGIEISGSGTLEVVQDGFGFLRSPEANYLPGPDDIYVSPSQIRKFGLR
ncbi:MAG: rho, partial [Phenylobacterium sp.]|nr:rho [Phenylobacterium sp.]